MGTLEFVIHLLPLYFVLKWGVVKYIPQAKNMYVEKGLDILGYLMIFLILWLLYGLYTDIVFVNS